MKMAEKHKITKKCFKTKQGYCCVRTGMKHTSVHDILALMLYLAMLIMGICILFSCCVICVLECTNSTIPSTSTNSTVPMSPLEMDQYTMVEASDRVKYKHDTDS